MKKGQEGRRGGGEKKEEVWGRAGAGGNLTGTEDRVGGGSGEKERDGG